MATLREESRRTYTAASYPATHQEIQIGSIQRIADACELMAKRYADLIQERDWAIKSRDEWRERAERNERRVNAYRGTVTRMKKGVSRG